MTPKPASLTFEIMQPHHEAAVAALLDLAFGPGRFAKAAARLREGNRPIPELNLLAFENHALRASVQFWPVVIGDRPALLLGPLAVDPVHRGRGIGLALMSRGLERARQLGHDLVVLIGDEPYYAKVGFVRAPAPLTLPGPVDPRRVLLCPLTKGALEGVAGPVSVPRRGS